MSFSKCVASLNLAGKIPSRQLINDAAEYEAKGMAREDALIKAAEDLLITFKLEEQSVIDQVRARYVKLGGKPMAAKTAKVEQPASVSEAPAAETTPVEQAEETKESILSALDERTPKGEEKPYVKRNLIADYFSQTPGTDDGTKRPLAAVKDFALQMKEQAKAFLPEDMVLTTAQDEAINTFLEALKEWAPKINANVNPASNKDYRYRDMSQFLLNADGQFDDNTLTAVVYSGFSWVAENATRSAFNTPAEINAIMNRDEDALVSQQEMSLLGLVGTRQNVVANALGQRVVQALGLKALKNAPQNLQADLEAAIGAHVMKMLLDAKVLERTIVTGATMQALTGNKNTDANAQFQFIKIARDANFLLNAEAESILSASKNTQGVLDKIFGVEAGLKEPGLEPFKSKQKTTRNTQQGIPSTLEAIIAKEDAAANYVRQDMFNLMGQISPEIALQIAGSEVVDSSVQKSKRASIQAKNDGLKREYDRFMEYVGDFLINTKDGLDQAMYFEHSVWKQQRVGIATNVVNPQTSKIHRHMLFRKSWETQVDRTDAAAMENFQLRVAEGLGIKTDKQSNVVSITKFRDAIQDTAIKAAVKVLRKSITTGGQMTANEQEVLLAGVKAGGESMHSLDALMALAHYAEAVSNDKKTFTVQLMGEVDGVTNGPMLTHLLMGAAASVGNLFGLLNRGGFYELGNAHTQYNLWRGVAGHLDLYEITALHMTQDIQASKINGNVLGALYAFTGELTDANGSVLKDGRNIIKTPLTAMVFGSSVTSAVDSMADKFIEGIYAKIEDAANGKGTRDQVVNNLNTLGVDLSDLSIEGLMEHEFTTGQVATLKGVFKDTIGKSVKSTMQRDFSVFIEQRKQFNLTAQMTFELYNATFTAMRDAKIAELVASGDIAVDGKGNPIHDLTAAQEKEIRIQLDAMTPLLHTAMSSDSKDLNAGLHMSKAARKLSDRSMYQSEVKFGTPFADNNAKSTNVNAYEVVETAPGVAMMPMSTHAADSKISHTAVTKTEALNVHDAHGLGLGNFQEGAKNLNQATWETMLNYSPANEMADSLLRTIKGLSTLLKDGNLPDSVVNNLASVIVDFSISQEANPASALEALAIRAKQMAYTADSMKLDAMSEMGSVDQYALEGGAYAVTADDRASAASLRSTLDADLTADDRSAIDSVVGALAKAVQAEADKREGKVPAPDPEMDTKPEPEALVSELGKPVIKSDPGLVNDFITKPVMNLKEVVGMLRGQLKSEFQQKLLSALERSTGSDITVRFVTPDTKPSDLLAQGGDKSRGWYVSTNDEQAIYILSPEFKHSGLTAELLLHELTHAALARTIDKAQTAGKGDAFELVQQLELLRSKAGLFIQANGLSSQFDPAIENVHELVSWGMNNEAFQQQVLMQIDMTPSTKGNTFLSGMKSFIDTLTALLFGKANPTMANGMVILITNTSGLFNAAMKQKNNSAANLVLNQTNNNSLRDYSTTDIYTALVQQGSNNGRQVSSSFGLHLQSLLDGIVSQMHGPFGSFKAAIMAQRDVQPEDVFMEAMATGVAPFASASLASGFAFTNEEAFVLEQVEATVAGAIEAKHATLSAAYHELSKLYEEVKAELTVEDMYIGDYSKASQAEQAEAKSLYDFIFNVQQSTDGRSDYLSRFAAMGLAHEGFNSLLSKTTPQAATVAKTKPNFSDRLKSFFNSVLEFFGSKITHTYAGQKADVKLTTLVTQLVQIEEKQRATLEAKAKYLEPLQDGLGNMAEGLKKQVAKFGQLPFFQQSGSGIVRLAGTTLSVYAGDRVEAVMENMQRFRDHHFRGQQGLTMALVNETRGSTASTLIYHFLLRATKFIEGRRKELITETGNVVLGSFINNGDDLTAADKKAVTAVFLRTDMSSLVDHCSMQQLHTMLQNPARIITEISKLEANLVGLPSARFNRYYNNAVKALGYYKATGKVTAEHMMMNAGNIARLYGTQHSNKITEQDAAAVEAILNPLVSLYALSYTNAQDRALSEVRLRTELARPDGGNGVEMLLKTHKQLQEQSEQLLFADSKALAMKGYTPEIYDPYMEVLVAVTKRDPLFPDVPSQGEMLVAQGYTQGAEVGSDKSDPDGETKHIYHLRNGGLVRRVSGVFSYTGTSAKGARTHNGNLNPLSYNGQLNAANMASIKAGKAKGVNDMFVSTGFDPASVKDTFLAPIVNAKGDVVNYRYLMAETTKDTLLNRDNRPEKILGSLSGNIYDKVKSSEQNARAVEALYEQYQEEYAERPESYMTVGPKSTDPQLREIWALLPNDTKQAVKKIWGGEQMKVRVDLLDMNFGYRKLSLADAFEEDADQRTFMQEMFVEIMTQGFKGKAALRTRQFEAMWQEMVKATKANLVLKSWSTFSGNLRSNWSQLILLGVNPVAIVKGHHAAMKGYWEYRKDSKELFALQHQITTGYFQPGVTMDEAKNKVIRLEDSLNRNPIRPLIEAGLMPTIVEDAATDDNIYSYKSRFVEATSEFTSHINPHIRKVASEVLMLEGSSAYEVAAYMTQVSDFMARYTLYQAKTTGKDALSHEEAIQLASDAFINYDVPTHRTMQYANDSGMVMFSKYYIRIQKMLARIYRDSPGKVMMMIAVEKALGDQPTVLDSSMITRWGNPLNMGALSYPSSLDELTTVKLLTSPFRSGGGNPADY
jgi:hypothetical protein